MTWSNFHKTLKDRNYCNIDILFAPGQDAPAFIDYKGRAQMPRWEKFGLAWQVSGNGGVLKYITSDFVNDDYEV